MTRAKMSATFIISLFVASCGAENYPAATSHQDVFEDPNLIVGGSKYYGKSWANRSENFRKDNDDGWLDGREYAGEKAEVTKQYFYERGVEEMRHGNQNRDGKDGEAGTDGVAGKDGATGPVGPQGIAGAKGSDGRTGAAGSAGPKGEAGPAGKDGEQGPAGDDFDGDERLTAVEDQLATLEAVVDANTVLTDARLSALEAEDLELANAIADLQDELDRTQRKLRRLKDKQRRDVRRLMWYILYVVGNQPPTYDIDVDIHYEDNDTNIDIDYEDNDRLTIDNRTIYRIQDILVSLMYCPDRADCEIDDIELD